MTTETTPNLALPYIMPAQAQKHVTHNEAIRALDAVVQLSVLDATLTSPPAIPDDGARYIVAAGATGAWVGHVGNIAAYQDGAWLFYVPREGWTAWVASVDKRYVFDGTGWILLGGAAASFAPVVGINTTADASNRLAVKSNAVLFSHDDVTPGTGDVRATFNKASAAASSSLLFQTGYSGRVEMGTTGDDKLHVKVSADGATWVEGMVMDSTGRVGLGTASPANKLDIVGTLGSVSVPLDGANLAFTRNNLNYITALGGSSSILRLVGGSAVSFATVATSSERVRITNVGDVGIGTSAPSCKLQVVGAIRCASYTVATVPSATTSGAGAMIYVSNPAIGAARPYWSNGTSWFDAAGVLLA